MPFFVLLEAAAAPIIKDQIRYAINPGKLIIFPTIIHNVRRKDKVAKSNYSFNKRKKELKRKLKQQQKRERKLNQESTEPDEATANVQEKDENS